MRRFTLFATLALTLVLLVSACGGATATATPRATTTASTSAPAATVVPNVTARPTTPLQPTATPAPVSQGTLSIALLNLAASGMLAGQVGNEAGGFEMMYDKWVGTNDAGKPDGTQGVLTSWQASPDSKTWTFKLRNDVSFHNGDKVTAADLKSNIAYAVPGGGGIYGTQIRTLVGMDQPDETTLIVNLTEPHLFWPISFLSALGTGSIPQYVINGKYLAQVGITEYSKKPVSSGPYRLQSLQVGDRITYEAIEKHWLFGVPRTKTVFYVAIPEESTRRALVQQGQLDIAPISTSSVKTMNQAGFKTVSVKEKQAVVYIFQEQFAEEYPGYGKNPIANQQVRKALTHHAIDRQALVDSIMNSIGVPWIDYPLLPSELAYKPNARPLPRFDPALAKRMIADAGWPNGFEMDMYFFTPGRFSEGLELSEALAVMWEQVGLKINRLPRPAAQSIRTADQIDKVIYRKPTAWALYAVAVGPVGTTTASNFHTIGNPNTQTRDPVGAKLVKDWTASPSVEEYIKRGQAYQEWETENVAGFGTILLTGDVMVQSNKVPAAWNPGNDMHNSPGTIRGARFQYAAAMRY